MIFSRLVPSELFPRLIIGIFLPVLMAFVIVTAIFISVRNLGNTGFRELQASGIKESTTVLARLGERLIEQKAQDVAKQIESFFVAHPNNPNWATDRRLRQIAVQRVGETGYTAVHDDRGINYFHVNTKLVGTDLHALSGKLPDFVKILDAGMQVQASGYYNWRDHDGSMRPKYMVTVPVNGTNLVVAATSYIDEFSRPSQFITDKMNEMQEQYLNRYNNRFILYLVIVASILVILLFIIYLYALSIVRPIHHLSEVADRISMGDLDTSVDIKGKGEVLRLADSIERMRISIKAIIERLQKTRAGSGPGR